jgi:hypothetical protein
MRSSARRSTAGGGHARSAPAACHVVPRSSATPPARWESWSDTTGRPGASQRDCAAASARGKGGSTRVRLTEEPFHATTCGRWLCSKHPPPGRRATSSASALSPGVDCDRLYASIRIYTHLYASIRIYMHLLCRARMGVGPGRLAAVQPARARRCDHDERRLGQSAVAVRAGSRGCGGSADLGEAACAGEHRADVGAGVGGGVLAEHGDPRPGGLELPGSVRRRHRDAGRDPAGALLRRQKVQDGVGGGTWGDGHRNDERRAWGACHSG